MKKIINNKRYDTETAEYLANASYGNYGDFSHWEEDLYRKRTGEYFLYGAGGAMTKYAESCGQNEWSGGEKIIPLSVEAAQSWAEKHLDGDEYERIFGEVEDDTKRTATFSLTEGTIEQIRRGAARMGISLSDYITFCVQKQAGE